ncbi:MAG: CBASS cGAMP-activated phospholipase [Pseudomonadota bacterium]
MARPFVILSLSGGGYCGVYTARILELIEEQRRGVPICESVDLIGGTSIGGILALGLSHGISAKALKNAFMQNGPEIFKDSGSKFWRKAKNSTALLRQMVLSKYSNQELEKAIDDMIPGKSFKEAEVPCLVSSVCATNGKPHIFRNYDRKDAQLSSKKVAMATSAAPIYFPPAWIDGQKYIDGGIVANNPDNILLSDALAYFRQEISQLIVISVGATNNDMSSPSVRRGFNGLLPNLFSIRTAVSFAMEAQQELSRILAENVLGENYARITSVPNESKKRVIGLDRATQAATDTLISMANDEFKVSANKRAIRILCNGELKKSRRWRDGAIVLGV